MQNPYGHYPYGQPAYPDNYYDSQSYQQAIEGIKKAIQGEQNDRQFYEYLISAAPSQEDKQIITSIRDDEIKHRAWFRQMLQSLTGQSIEQQPMKPFVPPASYMAGLREALFGELAAVESYRLIKQGLPNRAYQDTMYIIITDEQKHADKYNYLIAKNRVNSNSSTPSQPKSPDDWVRYVQPLVDEAMEDMERGINHYHLFQEFIVMGVLVGQGYSPEMAYETVERWEQTGESQLLKQSKQQPPMQ